VLGATGSIGLQTLDVAGRLGMEIKAVGARRGSDQLLEIARKHPECAVAVAAPTVEERDRLSKELGGRVQYGAEAIEAQARLPGVTVVNGIVGSAGLPASVAALESGNRLALANKESLVAGGPVVVSALRAGGGELIPVDSEHSAIFQCLVGEDPESIRRLLLCASGGPLRGQDLASMADVTVDEALAHPTWNMGPRITIDSATLMNKAFEVIEAHHLFGVAYDDVEVVVHPQSVVHSLVEFIDGSVKAQLGEPDMRTPIQYALTYPHRSEPAAGSLVLTEQSLTFETPDLEAFPCLRLGYEAGRAGGSAPAVLNAADEVAVQAFLQGRIGLTAIVEIVENTLSGVEGRPIATVEEVMAVDAQARAHAAGQVGGSC
jgi:1-deoxy-D-xylulose-5-phosphate reductoisomerase